MANPPVEICIDCDEPTEKAGACEDSLYCECCGEGPFCEACFSNHECVALTRGEPPM